MNVMFVWFGYSNQPKVGLSLCIRKMHLTARERRRLYEIKNFMQCIIKFSWLLKIFLNNA